MNLGMMSGTAGYTVAAGRAAAGEAGLQLAGSEIDAWWPEIEAAIRGALDPQRGRPLARLHNLRAALSVSGARELLLDGLAYPTPERRFSASRLCAACRLVEAVPHLQALLFDPYPAVAGAALEALGELHSAAAADILRSVQRLSPFSHQRIAGEVARAAPDHYGPRVAA